MTLQSEKFSMSYFSRFVSPFFQQGQRVERSARNFTICSIKNFADYLGEQKLTELFLPFGEIIAARIMVDEEGHSRGFGFVAFKEPASAERAVTEMNERLIDATGKLLQLDVAEDVPGGTGWAAASAVSMPVHPVGTSRKLFVGRPITRPERQAILKQKLHFWRLEIDHPFNGYFP